MANWLGSDRKERLPPDWPKIRKRILKRDGHRCRWTIAGHRCEARATDVDHIVPGDDHSDDNLQSLCGPHHLRKTGRDSHNQRRKAIAKAKWRNDRRFGHQEEHSGSGQSFRHPWQRGGSSDG